MESYSNVLCALYDKHLVEEDIDRLPIKQILFTDDIASTILQIVPELEQEPGFDESKYKNLSGITHCFADNTAVVLLDKLCLKNSILNNFFWVETFIHEITHVADFYNNIGIMGKENMYELMHCEPLWYWSEFHAKYKGTMYMLKFVSELPVEYKEKYSEDVSNRIRDFEMHIIKAAGESINIYSLLHIMGESIAYKQSGLEITSFGCRDLIEFESYLTNLTEKADITELLNLKRILVSFKTK